MRKIDLHHFHKLRLSSTIIVKPFLKIVIILFYFQTWVRSLIRGREKNKN
jgi:hypothetical protein